MPDMDEDQILMMALIGAIIGHFAEIQFAIAIGSTRTYFWIFSALLVLLGYRLRQPVSAPIAQPVQAARPRVSERIAAMTAWLSPVRPALVGIRAGLGTSFPVPSQMARKRRRDKVAGRRLNNSGAAIMTRTAPSMSSWANSVIVYGLILGVILQIMVFNFISPNLGNTQN